MNSPEQGRNEKGTAERLTARFAELWAENRRLARRAEEWAAFESSTAWALAQRLSQWRRRLAPEGSWRQKGWRFLLRLLWPGRQKKNEPSSQNTDEQACAIASDVSWEGLTQLRSSESRANVFLVDPKRDKFRVAYIGSRIPEDAASMRYRAYNLIESLTRVGLNGTFIPQEEIGAELPTILAHDLIVLVRRMRSDAVTTLIGLARRRGLPIVYDIDDYIFDPWVLPYVEAFQHFADQAQALRFLDGMGACLDQCDYFTGSTPYLAEKAAALGKESFVIHNGLNSVQLQMSQLAREQRGLRRGPCTRIGYFSGTRTHQADFRIVYPALMRILRERHDIRLAIAGHLDVGAFPGLAPFLDQIDLLPSRHWSELPAAIASVDINVIPLELTPFNEGKSNLKYYEAGLVEVPSIASPTRILCDSIQHGHNGLLARTTDEWYVALKELIEHPGWREQMGRNALKHVMQDYAPEAIGAEAAAVYRQIMELHSTQHQFTKQTLKIVMLVTNIQGGCDDALRQANELSAAGHTVTVYVSSCASATSTTRVEQSDARHFPGALFAVQHGGEVPCCDVLMATDVQTAELVRGNQHRARVTIADEDQVSTILKAGRGLELLLRDWLQYGPATPSPLRAA